MKSFSLYEFCNAIVYRYLFFLLIGLLVILNAGQNTLLAKEKVALLYFCQEDGYVSREDSEHIVGNNG